jgi:hypothetical protein
LLALALPGVFPARAVEPYHLRLGWVVTPADLVTLMFVKPGLALHAGKTYIPELTHFAGTPAEMTALATGDLDCAALAYSTFALGVENAGMADLQIIGDEFQDGVPVTTPTPLSSATTARSKPSTTSRERFWRQTRPVPRSTWRCARCWPSIICRTSAT